MNKAKPRKVTPPSAVISFSKSGTVRKKVEPMPDDQEAIEELIVERFALTLEQRYGRRIERLSHLAKEGKDPPDFQAVESGKTIGIEVTEVVDPSHRRLHSARQDYGGLVRDALLRRGLLLRGIIVEVIDSNGEPSYPPTSSKKGKEIVESVVAHIEQQSARIGGLSLGGEQHLRLPNSVCSCLVFRRVAADIPESEPVRLTFQGGYLVSGDDSLLSAIDSKTAKRYSLPPGAELWLLTYGLLCPSGPEAIKAARNKLSVLAHPFAQVWYAFPMPHRSDVLLQQVWPGEDPAS